MILPTQATFGLAATNLMQSMLDGIEEQRRQDEEKATGDKRDPVVEARISAGIDAMRAKEKIAAALFGINSINPNELKIQLTERLAAKLGIDLSENRSNFALGRAIEEAIKPLDSTQISELEEELGLKAAGVSLATVVAAIKNPYGDDNARLMEGLTKVASGGKADFDMPRVLRRLEDVADPKTLEELKLGPQGHDPTRVEDAGTRAERRQDIQALEASERLEDVQEMQDAVEKQNDKATRPTNPGEPTPAANAAEVDMIVVLGAAVEQTRDAKPGSDEAVQEPAADNATGGNALAPADDSEINEINAEAIENVAAEELTEAQPDVLPISIDEIGLYELLKKKLAA